MDNYIKLLQEHKVSHLVCATDQLYKTEELTKSGNKSSKTGRSVVIVDSSLSSLVGDIKIWTLVHLFL